MWLKHVLSPTLEGTRFGLLFKKKEGNRGVSIFCVARVAVLCGEVSSTFSFSLSVWGSCFESTPFGQYK